LIQKESSIKTNLRHNYCLYLAKRDCEAIKMMKDTKILVVDDEEVVRLSYARSLASDHCKVEMVSNGPAALEAMGQHPFDVVLLDLLMPGMNGMAVLSTIKQRWPESEVIIITGYPALETAKEAVTLGAHDYLAKPAGPDDIVNATHSAMMHKQWTLRNDQAWSCAGLH
jgi:DNA-binding NtrC family response regulator